MIFIFLVLISMVLYFIIKMFNRKKETKEMFCKSCGKKLERNERFCGQCGTNIGDDINIDKNEDKMNIKKTIKIKLNFFYL